MRNPNLFKCVCHLQLPTYVAGLEIKNILLYFIVEIPTIEIYTIEFSTVEISTLDIATVNIYETFLPKHCRHRNVREFKL